MIELDTDLRSRQNARVLVRNAKKAQAIMATFSQQQIDAIVKNVAQKQHTTLKHWQKWPQKKLASATGRIKS